MIAMILAAGRGERMRPLTDHTPKPLLLAGGKSLLVWQIERLITANFRDIVINHAHLGALIETTLGDGSALGVRIRYSPETTALETAGGIALALPLLSDPFLVVNGDVWCELDLGAFCHRGQAALQQGADSYLALVNNPAHHAQGDFLLPADGRLQPQGSERSAEQAASDAPSFTFSGIGLYRPPFFDGITPGSVAKLRPYLLRSMAANRCAGEHYAGTWLDIGTPERLADLDQHLRQTNTSLL